MQEFAESVGDNSKDWSYRGDVAEFAIACFAYSNARSF
jgi:hypothetical protein